MLSFEDFDLSRFKKIFIVDFTSKDGILPLDSYITKHYTGNKPFFEQNRRRNLKTKNIQIGGEFEGKDKRVHNILQNWHNLIKKNDEFTFEENDVTNAVENLYISIDFIYELYILLVLSSFNDDEKIKILKTMKNWMTDDLARSILENTDAIRNLFSILFTMNTQTMKQSNKLVERLTDKLNNDLVDNDLVGGSLEDDITARTGTASYKSKTGQEDSIDFTAGEMLKNRISCFLLFPLATFEKRFKWLSFPFDLYESFLVFIEMIFELIKPFLVGGCEAVHNTLLTFFTEGCTALTVPTAGLIMPFCMLLKFGTAKMPVLIGYYCKLLGEIFRSIPLSAKLLFEFSRRKWYHVLTTFINIFHLQKVNDHLAHYLDIFNRLLEDIIKKIEKNKMELSQVDKTFEPSAPPLDESEPTAVKTEQRLPKLTAPPLDESEPTVVKTEQQLPKPSTPPLDESDTTVVKTEQQGGLLHKNIGLPFGIINPKTNLVRVNYNGVEKTGQYLIENGIEKIDWL